MSEPTAHTCCRCDRAMRHDTALVCTPCANLLRRHLEGVALVAGDITITVAKLSAVSRSGGSGEDLGWWKNPEALEPVPLPYDPRAAERHDAAVGELGTWARMIVSDRGPQPRRWVGRVAAPPRRVHPLAETAAVLVDNLEWLRHQPFADEAWPSLLAASAELQRIVDTHVPADLLGLCACGTARYGNDRSCRRCGTVELEHTREAMDEAMAGAVVTASEAAQWVAYMGLVESTAKLRKLIWAWADRGHLEPVDDIPRYRFGDVLTRVMASPALRAA